MSVYFPFFLLTCYIAFFREQQKRHSSFDSSDSLKGKSMLVAAIMDIVTANCESADKVVFKPSLPGNAEMRDIAAAIEVIEEGGLHLDEVPGNDEDGNSEIKGIGIKVLGGTSVLGLTRSNGLVELMHLDNTQYESLRSTPKSTSFDKIDDSLSQASLSSAAIPGLWDDLHSQHIAVPFAAWALANWAMASEENRSHIQELDCDGNAVMTALIAPERSITNIHYFGANNLFRYQPYMNLLDTSVVTVITDESKRRKGRCKEEMIQLLQIIMIRYCTIKDRDRSERY